jgi:hypothetical protein
MERRASFIPAVKIEKPRVLRGFPSFMETAGTTTAKKTEGTSDCSCVRSPVADALAGVRRPIATAFRGGRVRPHVRGELDRRQVGNPTLEPRDRSIP